MRRTLVGGLIALVVGLLLVWFFWLRGGGDKKPDKAAGSARSAKVDTPKQPAKQPEAPKDAPRGTLPKWALDLDKEGPLTLEGQVVGPDGKGVAKGEALLKPVSPGYAMVDATAEGYAPSNSFTTVGSAGSIAKLTITLHKGYAITGRVIDESGKPIAKVRVAVAGGQRFDWTQL